MAIIDAIKALTPVTEWRKAAQPTGSVAGAVGDHGYLFTEVGIHENRLYQIVHYGDESEKICAVFAIDVLKGPSVVEGVGKYIDDQGRFSMSFFDKMQQRFGASLSVAITRTKKIEFGLFGDGK